MRSLWGFRVEVNKVLGNRDALINLLKEDEHITEAYLVEVKDTNKYLLNEGDTGLLFIAGDDRYNPENIQDFLYSDYETYKETKELINKNPDDVSDEEISAVYKAAKHFDNTYGFIELEEFKAANVAGNIDNVLKGGTETDLKLVENLYIKSL